MIHRIQLLILSCVARDAGRRGHDWQTALAALGGCLDQVKRFPKRVERKLFLEYQAGRRQAERKRRATK